MTLSEADLREIMIRSENMNQQQIMNLIMQKIQQKLNREMGIKGLQNYQINQSEIMNNLGKQQFNNELPTIETQTSSGSSKERAPNLPRTKLTPGKISSKSNTRKSKKSKYNIDDINLD